MNNFRCQPCSRRFLTEAALVAHNTTKHPPIYDCSKCNKTFPESDRLAEHYRGSPQHPNCHFCGTGCKDLAALDEHINRDHTYPDFRTYQGKKNRYHRQAPVIVRNSAPHTQVPRARKTRPIIETPVVQLSSQKDEAVAPSVSPTICSQIVSPLPSPHDQKNVEFSCATPKARVAPRIETLTITCQVDEPVASMALPIFTPSLTSSTSTTSTPSLILWPEAQPGRCNICQNSFPLIENPRVTMCGHLYCQSCIDRALQSQRLCPVCRTHLLSDSFIFPCFMG
ncbi:hypothetical protein C8J56DRAFT_297506 [Mycena floridula]|nr:hypothetical protein C8J56DRAFT_297506 [Mycena floridula]